MKSRAADIIFALLLALATLLLYRKVTRLFWTYDDAYLLHIAIEHPAPHHFFGTALWKTLAQPLFTPMLTATYDAELEIFGLDAAAFYRLQLFLLAILAIEVFAAARLWLATDSAFVAALLFIAGAPVCAIAMQLMTVHYIESAIFGVGAFALFAIASRRNSQALAIVSASLYLLAMLSKEIAVPLLLALWIVPEFRKNRLLTIPHVIALLSYAVWRRAALGMWFGGYGRAIRLSDLPSLAAEFPRAVFEQLTAKPIIAGVALLLLVILGIGLWARSWKRTGLIALLILLTIAPTLPMARRFESRFALALWLVCAVVAAAGFDTIWEFRVRIVLTIATLALVLVVNRQRWASEFFNSRRMSDEARVFLDLHIGDALRKPAVPPSSMIELAWLKDVYMRRPSGALWFYDDLYLCTNEMPRRVFGYVAAKREVIEERDVAKVRDKYCKSIRDNAPLSAKFEHRGESLFWKFGPYDRGTYGVVFGNGISALELHRDDGFRLPRVHSLRLRVRYAAPEGWVTYSPDLSLDFSRESNFEWHR